MTDTNTTDTNTTDTGTTDTGTTAVGDTALDENALKFFSFQVFSKLEGAVTAGMIHLGDQLGLYTALKEAGQPITTAELAERTNLVERWVREWAHNQAAAKLVSVDEGGRFGLTPEAAVVFATPDHPSYR